MMKKRGMKYLNARPFQAWIGLAALVNVVTFLFLPNTNPIHELVAPWDYVWAFTYGFAGLTMLVGMFANRANLESAGLMMLLGGVSVQILVYASLGIDAWQGTLPTLVSLTLLTGAILARLRELLKASAFLNEAEHDE